MGTDAAESKSYSSPPHKLLQFFHRSRDKWKQKAVDLRYQMKLIRNQVRAVEQSRDQWRAKAEQAIADAKRASAELETLKKTQARPQH